MRDAGGQQADRRELLCLSQLRLELDARGDVVNKHDAPYRLACSVEQRCDGDVDDPLLIVRQVDPDFIEAVCTLLATDRLQP